MNQPLPNTNESSKPMTTATAHGLNQVVSQSARSGITESSVSSSIDCLEIDCATLGGHVQHWAAIGTENPDAIPEVLQLSLTDADIQFGLLPHIPENHSPSPNPQADAISPPDTSVPWVITGPQTSLQITQIIQRDHKGHPSQLMSAFPSLDSQTHYLGTIQRIIRCKETQEGILTLQLNNGVTVHAFDGLHAINYPHYQANTVYQLVLGAIAYELERVGDSEVIEVTDPAALHHHHAMTAILAEHNGVAPADMNERIQHWKPENNQPLPPVSVNIAKMVAYLYGDQLGQEDEAWIQGEIIGKRALDAFDHHYLILDTVVSRENPDQPLVIPIVLKVDKSMENRVEVGDFVRGNIWLQGAIHGINKH